jgi:hypothetical protein
MKAISEYTGQELLWIQRTGFSRSYELRADAELLATLQFRGGTLADVETADGRWTFKRQGFWHQQITVRATGSDEDIALFRPHWTGGGNFIAGNGTGVEFASANFWHSEWSWKDRGHAVITYRGPRGLIKAEASMEVAPAAREVPNIAMLAVLGWYLILLFGRDMAASTAARTAAVGTVVR